MSYEITIADHDAELEASFAPEAGMIGCSLRHRGEELLHQGDGLEAYRERAATFALPLLHPWANRVSAWQFELDGRRVSLDHDSPITHRDGATGTAIHGLLAASTHWTVIDADRDRLSAQLDFASVPEYMAAFPFPHTVSYEARVREATLSVTFAVTATGTVRVPVSFGFHPYLTLPGSDRRDWQLEIPAARRALVDERMLPTGETVAIAPGELDGPLADRIFDTGYPALHGEQPELTVSDDRRRLSLRHVSGYPVSQVYAPAGSRFICFEPMTAPVDALVSGDGLRWVDPGERFEAVFEIAVSAV